MGIGVLWVPALAGYLFLTQFNGTKFTLLRSTGYQFVLRAAVAGVVLYAVATGISWLGTMKLPIVGDTWRQLFPLEYSGTAAISFVIGLAAPWFLNWIPVFNEFRSQRRAAFEDGDQIGLLVDRAIQNGQFVEISLSSSKSYVGRVVHGTFGHRDAGDVLMVPVFSGYRDGETQNLVLTTNYAPALRDSVENDPLLSKQPVLEQFRVAIPFREIVSVRVFDIEIYREYYE